MVGKKYLKNVYERRIIEVLYNFKIIKIEQFYQKLQLVKLEEVSIELPISIFIIAIIQYFIFRLKVHDMISNYYHKNLMKISIMSE